MNKLFVVMIAGLFLWVGCTPTEETDADSDGADATAQQVTGASGEAVELDGVWSKGCTPREDGLSNHVVTTLSGSDRVNVGTRYFSADCTGESKFTFDITATFTVGDAVDADLAGVTVSANKLDTERNTFDITPSSAEVADQWNSIAYCEIEDWAVGVASDVLICITGTDLTSANIVYIDDTADPNIMFQGNAETAGSDGYPTALDDIHVWRSGNGVNEDGTIQPAEAAPGAGGSTPVPSLTITGASGASVELDGDWGGVCYDASDGNSGSESNVTTVSGNSMSGMDDSWPFSLDCSGSSEVSSGFETTFVVGDQIQVAQGAGTVTATKIVYTATSYTYTPNNSTWATAFNSSALCGFTDWSAGETKELIDNAECGLEVNPFKGLIYIDDTVTPNVWYDDDIDPDGDGVDDLDADGYPTAILEEGEPRM